MKQQADALSEEWVQRLTPTKSPFRERSPTMPATSLSAPSGLNSPYGGTLIDLRVNEARTAEIHDRQGSRQPVARRVGALRPGTPGHRHLLSLEGFLNRADYERVVAEMRLADGTLWPLPIALPVTPGRGRGRGPTAGSARRLRQPAGLPPRRGDLRLRQGGRGAGAYGSTDAKHPSVAYLQRQPGHYAAGRLEVMRTPPITTSSSCGGRRPSCGRTSRTWVGPGSSRSRPATRCTAPTRN